jgi:hypothetical protein
LKPKNAMARKVTGTIPIASRIRLMIISALTNSIGRSGLIIRLVKLRDHISSRNDIEKPSWPRNSTSHISTAAMKTPLARAKKPEFWAM